ncbi:hypothetical protein [Streptomyces sp. NBC_01589]|uniref:hypothetical protein n=1 Tax=unclassified Streptomyces TaxID=2593676 RepID=UPI003869A2E2
MARTADSGMNRSMPRPDRAGRRDEVHLPFEKVLTRPDHLGLCTEEISHTGEQLANAALRAGS